MKTLLTFTLFGALALSAPALADDAPPALLTSTPSAQEQCRTERIGVGVETFRQTYGTNKNRRNAFGKCVSKREAATEEAAAEAKQNASQECKAEAGRPGRVQGEVRNRQRRERPRQVRLAEGQGQDRGDRR